MNNIESNTGEIVMYQPDETIRLEVRVENETVWLTQQQMAELFKATKQNISLHIRNIFEEGELEEFSTVKEYLTVRKATIYTRQLSQQQQLDIRRHNQQYPPINICTTQHNHDRFLIIDDDVYLFGASLKDAGKKLFAYIKMQETSSQELINRLKECTNSCIRFWINIQGFSGAPFY